MLVHLMRSGKLLTTGSSESDSVILVKKNVDRPHEFFFGDYVHSCQGVSCCVCRVACVVFVKS